MLKLGLATGGSIIGLPEWVRRSARKVSSAGTILPGAPEEILHAGVLQAEIRHGETSRAVFRAAMAAGRIRKRFPFVDELPIPPIAQPVASLNPAPNTANFQRYAEFPAQKFYDINVTESLYSFHRDLPPSPIWGYNGYRLGRPFTPATMSRSSCAFAIISRRTISVSAFRASSPHLHNAHTASESDGFPADFFEVGQFRDHHYPNVLAGYDAFPPKGDVRETLGTLWMHDHRQEFTAPNVYKGLAGFYFLFDERDSGNETDTSPGAFRCPAANSMYR